MYRYQDPPEIQSPEQRSVVFASLANLLTFFITIGCWQGRPNPYANAPVGFWMIIASVSLPILMSVLILYLGCLWAAWPRVVRLVMLLVLSALMLLAMLAFLISTAFWGLLCFGDFQVFVQEHGGYHY